MTDDPLILAGAVAGGRGRACGPGRAIIIAAVRKMRRDDAEAAEQRMAELARDCRSWRRPSAASTRCATCWPAGQAELHRAVNERLDSVTASPQPVDDARPDQHTADNLQSSTSGWR